MRCCREAGQSSGLLTVDIASEAYAHIMCTVGRAHPETGGLLLGPTDSDCITEFWFDEGAARSRVTYSPDTKAMNRLLRREWRPRGIDTMGIAHSHPPGYPAPTRPDVEYCARHLERNPDMQAFYVPIVLPLSFEFRMFVVLREDPRVARRALVNLI